MLTILKSLSYKESKKRKKKMKKISPKSNIKNAFGKICIYSMHFVGSETGFFFSKVRIKMDEHK